MALAVVALVRLALIQAVAQVVPVALAKLQQLPEFLFITQVVVVVDFQDLLLMPEELVVELLEVRVLKLLQQQLIIKVVVVVVVLMAPVFQNMAVMVVREL
jgi:hypothetical protein